MGAAGSIANETTEDAKVIAEKLKRQQALVEEFRKAVMQAAMNIKGCEGDECILPNPGNTGDKRLKSVFDAFDTNHDGVLDRSELDSLIQQLNFNVSDELKAELRSNMKNLLINLGDDSFHLVFSEFAEVINPASVTNTCRKIVSQEPKRIVFVGATGSGKSSLCTALTGQDKNNTAFKIGNKASSETTECKTERFHWFGDETAEEFVCIDTPGLDDELGRDNEHINGIIQEMQRLEYVNAIVMVVNGQNPRFSTSLQNMIQQFEKAFTAKFYEHSIICMTRWYMDEDSVAEREEDGRTEEKVTEDLNQKINSSARLLCRRKLPVLFVDSFYQRKDPKHGKQRLAKLQEVVGSNVFRTADLATIKPKIVELQNSDQWMKSNHPISMLQPILFDDGVQIMQWEYSPDLPAGLKIDPVKGTVTGTPTTATAMTQYKVRARSVGGWSDPFSFTLAIGHSEAELKSLVFSSLKPIAETLEAILPVSDSANGEPFDESEVKDKIAQAKSTGATLLQEKLQEMSKLYGELYTFPDFQALFQAEYDRKLISLENEFLASNQKAFDHAREKEKIENDLKLQLIRETTNAITLRNMIMTAEEIGGVDEDLLTRAKSWLEDITPGPCCNEGKGCLVKLMKRERATHEAICIFGLPTYSKQDVVREKGTDGRHGVIVNTTDKKKDLKAAEGKYGFDEDDQEFYFINRSEQTLFRIRSEAKGKFSMSSPTEVTWVITSAKSMNGEDTVIANSSNKVKDPTLAKWNHGFTVTPSESYHWKEEPVEVHPPSQALLLMYFGGKWCPYCPPFTRILAKFYESIQRQLGKESLAVIFASSDSNENEMFEYYMEEHGDWLAIPYAKRDIKNALSQKYGISGIPTCVLLNAKMEEVSSTPFLNNETVRGLFGALPEEVDAKFDSVAKGIYDKMVEGVNKSLGKGGSSSNNTTTKATTGSGHAGDFNLQNIDKNAVDIFCSLRFAEAQKEAHAVRQALKEHGITAVIIDDVQNGDDIAGQVADLLDAAKLVLIFGTETYGKGTESSFSTKEELQFVMAEKKPFFLIKMCERFTESRTRFHLPHSISYMKWNPGDPMPSNLIDAIIAKLKKINGEA